MKKDLSKDEETREFIKNIKPNKVLQNGRHIKSNNRKTTKKDIQCNKKPRKSKQNIWKA